MPHPQVHRLSTRPLKRSGELRVEQGIKVSQENAAKNFKIHHRLKKYKAKNKVPGMPSGDAEGLRGIAAPICPEYHLHVDESLSVPDRLLGSHH